KGKEKGGTITTINIWEEGYNLPDPDIELISQSTGVIHITAQEVCREYIMEIAKAFGIEDDDWEEDGWKNPETNEKITYSEIRSKIKKFNSFLYRGGCPEKGCLFSGLKKHYPNIDWKEWLVGGNVPVGFGNPEMDEAKAKKDIRRLCKWYLKKQLFRPIEEDIKNLCRIDLRSFEQYSAILKNHFRASPFEMVKFAFDEYEWVPTQFFKRGKQEARIYGKVISWLTEEEKTKQKEIPNEGYNFPLSGIIGKYPKEELSNGKPFGGGTPTADIFVISRNLLIDRLGEQHFEEVQFSRKGTKQRTKEN
ncbi:uncharacterized protein METZ01_LOCUS367586, partial [marine metagenome]